MSSRLSAFLSPPGAPTWGRLAAGRGSCVEADEDSGGRREKTSVLHCEAEAMRKSSKINWEGFLSLKPLV